MNARPVEMTEQDYIEALRAAWPRKGEEATLHTLHLASEAVGAYPQSARLWCMRGDLIQLGPEGSPYTLDDALQSYERATRMAASAEAWESIGHYHDAVTGNLAEAEAAFRRAIELGGGASSRAGLALVLAQRTGSE